MKRNQTKTQISFFGWVASTLIYEKNENKICWDEKKKNKRKKINQKQVITNSLKIIFQPSSVFFHDALHRFI